MLVFSIYVPPMDFRISNTLQTMQATFDEINAVIRSHTENPGRSVQLLVAGDFNRHHPAWTSSEVPERLMLHAEELVNFMQVHSLHSYLPKRDPNLLVDLPAKTAIDVGSHAQQRH